ncbi:cytochrome P450 [Actinomadura viridis]|uniref:Cytochrome P450 n=1 Tax=Actinomadura viridis TaxID=58110 RepID=A0A931DKE8_9ACTN|nr:cytochrome P450 [Actinomadura viridis]MBG6090339.1 cytochrome P450 [Actinomadura viridis]
METPTPEFDPTPLEALRPAPLHTAETGTPPSVFYEALRAEYGPVAPIDMFGVPAWLVMGYSQALEILRDSRSVWSKRPESWRALNEGRVPADWPLLHVYSVRNSLFSDGADLARLRGAWSAGLRPFQDRGRPQAKDLERAVTQYADDLLTLLSEGGRTGQADLVAQYARPLPLMIVNRLLGFENAAQGEEMLKDLWRMLEAGPEAAGAAARLFEAVTQVCTARLADPRDDLPSHMLAATPDMTVDELVRELFTVVGLVGDYVGTLIASTVAEVINGDEAVRDSLSAGMVQEVVNRALIANPPMAHLSFRYPTTDVRMGRFLIAAGDPVVVSPMAAHADPAFTGGGSPDAIYSTRAHLAWGAGAHACLGRELATTVTMIAVSRLFERFSALRPAVPSESLDWQGSQMSHALSALPVHYELAGEPVRQPIGPPPEQVEGGEDGGAPARSAGLSFARRVLRVLRRG